jgi:hypothetical protein
MKKIPENKIRSEGKTLKYSYLNIIQKRSEPLGK